MTKKLAQYFQLEEHKTTLQTEIIAGITTFVAMAYILIVNPIILEESGMNFGAVFTATAISAILATFFMGIWAKLPIALAPGMGLNAFFTYYVVLHLGYTWQFALTAILIEGIIFMLLSLFDVRESIINKMPATLKNAISGGIGFFICCIGLKNAHIIVADTSNLVTLGDLSEPTALLACIGLMITGIFLVRKVPAALLLGIITTTIIGFFLGVTTLPDSFISPPPSIAPVFFQFDFTNILSTDMLFVVFTFLMVDIFDTAGALIAFATRADLLDENGNFPHAKKALLCDAIGTTVGACLGTSTVTTFGESAAGMAAGGRTGLTALTTAICFVFALFLSPIILMVPSAATAPALILVGLFMAVPLKDIPFDDYSEGIPAFLTVTMMPFASSIADGIGFGVISYCLLKLTGGAEKRKDLNAMIIIVALLFLFKYLFL
ncbi:NCS2 family permease [Anaerovorax sp. IOR16]|uniref:NCS2 family permease n=1 Tax=Anaerovorax sp. IOR16 TaxID=2773458 RepID=UPI002ED2ED1C